MCPLADAEERFGGSGSARETIHQQEGRAQSIGDAELHGCVQKHWHLWPKQACGRRHFQDRDAPWGHQRDYRQKHMWAGLSALFLLHSHICQGHSGYEAPVHVHTFTSTISAGGNVVYKRTGMFIFKLLLPFCWLCRYSHGDCLSVCNHRWSFLVLCFRPQVQIIPICIIKQKPGMERKISLRTLTKMLDFRQAVNL